MIFLQWGSTTFPVIAKAERLSYVYLCKASYFILSIDNKTVLTHWWNYMFHQWNNLLFHSWNTQFSDNYSYFSYYFINETQENSVNTVCSINDTKFPLMNPRYRRKVAGYAYCCIQNSQKLSSMMTQKGISLRP